MNKESLDYEIKIFAPTKELYQQLSQQANELFEHAVISTQEVHAKIAETGLEFYNHPSQTASRWQTELSGKSDELYTFVNDNVIPAAKADYQHLISVATDYGVQARESIQFFIDNPKLVTVETFSRFNQGLIHFFDSSMNVSTQVLNDIGAQAGEIIDFLSNDPLQGIESLYYDSLSVLLNSYFDVVSSLLLSATY
ncbi:MAG: hypothetical protein GQ583_01445 [Methyloprofundus sp.]|nr:hypothetical protein [Methyloprofundus sp.]